MRRRFARGGYPVLAGCLVLLTALVGCSPVRDEVSPEQRLLERARAYWEARESGDLQTVFQLEAAGQPGGWLNAMSAAGIGGGIRLMNVKVDDPRVTGDKGKVSVVADVQVLVFTSTSGVFPKRKQDDDWVLMNGEWFHDTYKPTSLSRKGQQAPQSPAVPVAPSEVKIRKVEEAPGAGSGGSPKEAAGESVR